MLPALKTSLEGGLRNRIRKQQTRQKPTATGKLTHRVYWNIQTRENRLKHAHPQGNANQSTTKGFQGASLPNNPLARQRTPYWFHIRGDPICGGQRSPRLTTTPVPCPKARAPQNERPPQWKPAHHNYRRAPACRTWGKTRAARKTQHSDGINWLNK